MVTSDESEPSRRIFSSSRLVAFFTSARNQKLAENEPKFDSHLKTYSWLFFIINLYWKWLNYAAKSYHSTLKRPFVLISLHKWSWNWLGSCYRSKIGKFDIHIVSIVSSVSAQKLKFPSSAWLGSARNLHSSARLELENSSSNSSLVVTLHTSLASHKKLS